MKYLLLAILITACGTDPETDECHTEVTYAVCGETQNVSGDAFITEIRETNNVCDLEKWQEEGLTLCSFNEETGTYEKASQDD